MAYQQLRKQKNIPVSGCEASQISTTKAQAPGAATDGAGMGAQLDELMQARMQRMLDRQIPTAEREADEIAGSVTGARTPEEVKAQLGQQMGADFSEVRFHTGADAVEKAEGMGARAYATGRDVYFGEGGFDPAVAAHELVHTAQQGGVDSGMATVSAPAGGVQMLPKWADIKRGIGNVGHAIAGGARAVGRGIATGAKAVGRGFAAAGRGIAGLASKAWGGIKGLFSGGQAEQAAPQAPATPVGTSMMPLGGDYSASEMQSRVSALLPDAQREIAASSDGKEATDGNRFFFMRNGSNGDTRAQYTNMMKRAGRPINIQMLQDMAQNLDALPVADDIGGYKDLGVDDARRGAYQDRGLQMTQHYLDLLEQSPDALDALRQSSSGLYGGLGTYSDTNQAGLVGGKLEASHRAMNDMLLRSFGGDTVVGRRDLGLDATKDKKVAITGQAMAAMQPAILSAVMDPSKMQDLTPQEQQMAVMYQAFFQRNGML